jgi:tetratricopeptide (TPR) repeat protein
MQEKRISDLSISLAAIQAIVATVSLAALALFVVGWIIGVERVKTLQDFLSASSSLILSLLTISGSALALAFLVLFVRWLSKDEEGIMILPFEVPAGEEKYTGKALSHLLTAELLRIRRIHETEYEGVIPIVSENVKNVPIVKPSSENVTAEIANIGTLEAGTASVPLGQILVSIKRLWPWGTNSMVISGCLQKYGSSTSLIACLEDQNLKVWEARNIKKGRENIGDEIIPGLTRDLAYMIVYDLSREASAEGKKEEISSDKMIGEFSTKLKIRDVTSDEKITAKTWQGFRHFSEALDAYHKYDLTHSHDYLKQAKTDCIKAAESEINYELLIKLMYNLGINYTNKKMFLEAEEVLIKAKEIKEDDIDALFGLGYIYLNQNKNKEANYYFNEVTRIDPNAMGAWVNNGNAHVGLGNHKEAIDCYNEALKLNREFADPWIGKGGAFIARGNYLKALGCYNTALKLDPINSLAWSAKGDALSLLGRDELAKKSYEEAAKQRIKSATLFIALARLYRKLGPEADSIEACKTARDLIDTETEYNRACFEAVCGSPEAALALLRTALEKKQGTADWARRDPDFEFIRDDPRFAALLDEFSPGGKKGP